MLEILIEHNKNQPYMVEIRSDKPIRNLGSNIIPNAYDIVDLVEETIHDYRRY